jgi:hypothetical protein
MPLAQSNQQLYRIAKRRKAHCEIIECISFTKLIFDFTVIRSISSKYLIAFS